MSFTQAISTCFSKYVDFTGRASRSEFWFYYLFILIASFVLGIVDALMFAEMYWQPLTTVLSLATILPSFAVAARRLHDRNRSGWWQLLWLIPLVGMIILIVWWATKGETGPNRFGKDTVLDLARMT
jgi:uncharacterized membrane protein YhaH (DUF805 family)